MKLLVLSLLLAVVVINLFVEESSALWGIRRYRFRVPGPRRYWGWASRRYGRYRFVGKRENVGQGEDAGDSEGCDFKCFLAMSENISEEEINKLDEVFRSLDKDGDGTISEDEMKAFNPDNITGDAEGDQGGDTGGDQGGETSKRELMDEIAELRSLLNKPGDRK